jgi:hypothetical protein
VVDEDVPAAVADWLETQVPVEVTP